MRLPKNNPYPPPPARAPERPFQYPIYGWHWRLVRQCSGGNAARGVPFETASDPAPLELRTPGYRLRAGTLADFRALEQFHYLPNPPAVATRVLVIEGKKGSGAFCAQHQVWRPPNFASPRTPSAAKGCDSKLCRVREAPSAAREGRDRQNAPDPFFPIAVLLETMPNPSLLARGSRGGSARKDSNGVIAVLVETMPTLSSRLRDVATNFRFHKNPRILNKEVRRIARLVVHPEHQGLGLGVALVRHALATATTPITEAFALSGWHRSFFEYAGMRPYFPADRPDAPVYFIHEKTEGSGFGIQGSVPSPKLRISTSHLNP